MNATGVAPDVIGTEIRIGRLNRENASTKARRLLVEGRVLVTHVNGSNVSALVRGDSASLRRVTCLGGLWACDCPSRRDCSHILATQLVTLVDTKGKIHA